MADPVIVSSGHTFERACVEVCRNIGCSPKLGDDSCADVSVLIPNLALKSAIVNWCERYSVQKPKPVDYRTADVIVRTSVGTAPSAGRNPDVKIPRHSLSELLLHEGYARYSSGESACSTVSTSPAPPPPAHLATRRQCCHSSSSSSSSSSAEIDSSGPVLYEEGEIMSKLQSPLVADQKESLVSLRNTTRTREESRIFLCTPRILVALRSLIGSKYFNVQINALAAVVNLSLEKTNKVKIVRSGMVLPLIEVLKAGSPEAQEHTAGAFFSLALDDDNKTAIGVLGALPPLLHLLRSERERSRHDSALALYHLSLLHSNRTKLVKIGAAQTLLAMAASGHMTAQVLPVLCNIASCSAGRATMLDAGAVACMVRMLGKDEGSSGSCVAVLFALSKGSMRFKGLAKEAGADVLLKDVVEKSVNEAMKSKARGLLDLLNGVVEEDDQKWDELLGLSLSESDSDPNTGLKLIPGLNS